METNERFEAFTTAVIKAYKSINKIKSKEMEKMGLKGNYALFMFYLGKSADGLTSVELCKLCNEDKAAVSRTVSELIETGLIEQNMGDGSKRYRNRLVPTEKGKEILEKVQGAIARVVKRASDGLTEEERDGFYKVFFLITDNLVEICKTEV